MSVLVIWTAGGFSGFAGDDEEPSNAFHRVLEGRIGKAQEIRMVLECRDEEVEGYYYDKKLRRPFRLAGKIAVDETVLLDVTQWNSPDLDVDDLGRLRGKFDGEGGFSGRWKSPDGKKALPLVLREVALEDVLKVRPVKRAFHCELVHDAHTAGLGWDLEYVRFGPEDPGVGRINQWICSEMQEALLGVAEGVEEKKLVAGATDQSIEESLRGMANEEAMEATGFPPEAHKRRTRVVHNADGIVCLGMEYWDYEGGGHGEGGTEYAVFDVRTGTRFGLGDVLREGYRKPLAKIGERLLREQADASWNDPRAKASLSGDEREHEENWFVTVEGLGFSHSLDGIGAGGRGFVTHVIPFAELKPLMKEDSPLMRMIPSGK